MNTKTPAMVLQEFTVKHQYPPPEYNVMSPSKTGTHENEFYYNVSVAHITARGFGRSKQVAKHDAATQALKILAERGLYDSSSNPVQEFEAQSHRNESDSPQTPSKNHIGILKEYCVDNKIPQPDFKELSGVGPPHCREFTFECAVSSVKTQWTAKTKKQAKQLAAREMLEKIRNIYPELAEQLSTDIKRITETDDEAAEKFKAMTSPWQNEVVPNRGAKVKHYPKSLAYIMKEHEKVLDDFRELLAEQTWEALDKICEALNIEYRVETSQEEPMIMNAVFNIDTPLAMMALGSNEKETRVRLLREIFFAFNVFMQVPEDMEF